MNKADLILANGMVFSGKSFGSEGETIGEVVFTTSMTGYQETLTDPDYYGQILTHTFPLIGNYGINSQDNESDNIFLNGYIVREYCDIPSNFRSTETLDNFLKKHNIIGLYDIDTRKLTRVLREYGSMNGMLITGAYDLNLCLDKIKSFKTKNIVKSITVKEVTEYKAQKTVYNVAMVDYGYKKSLIRELTSRNCNVKVYPFDTKAEDIIKNNPDGIVVSSGAGDPNTQSDNTDNIRQLIDKNLPILGIGLGHQLIAKIMGFSIHKLKSGHRGSNQPVVDLKSGKTYITSQNHGYVVDNDSVELKTAQISHANSNDKTCEGLEYKEHKIITVQFNPQTLGLSNDTSYIYDKFISMLK